MHQQKLKKTTFTLDIISKIYFNSTHVECVLQFTLTLVSEQDRSHLRHPAVEADRDLIAVASHYQPPHQNGLVGQHGVLPVAHIFEHHLVSLR